MSASSNAQTPAQGYMEHEESGKHDISNKTNKATITSPKGIDYLGKNSK